MRDSGPKNVLTKNFLDRRGQRADDPQMTRIVQLSPHFAFVESMKFDKKMLIDSNGSGGLAGPWFRENQLRKFFIIFSLGRTLPRRREMRTQRSPHLPRKAAYNHDKYLDFLPRSLTYLFSLNPTKRFI